MLGLFRKDKAAESSGASEEAVHGEQREREPARVRIDSREYPLAALNRAVLVVDGFEGDFVAGQRFHFCFVLPLEGESVEVPTAGRVLHLAEGRLVARYYAPQPYYQRLMRQAIDSLPLDAA